MIAEPAMRPPLLKMCSRLGCRPVITATQRSLTTHSVPTPRPQPPSVLLRRPILRAFLREPFRRSYADVVTPKIKRRGRNILRWTWRLTYLSAIGGLVYLGYTIYDGQTPTEQIAADPTKKTLVILGLTKDADLSWLLLTRQQVLDGALWPF